jgi:hypothetical protein
MMIVLNLLDGDSVVFAFVCDDSFYDYDYVECVHDDCVVFFEEESVVFVDDDCLVYTDDGDIVYVVFFCGE